MLPDRFQLLVSAPIWNKPHGRVHQITPVPALQARNSFHLLNLKFQQFTESENSLFNYLSFYSFKRYNFLLISSQSSKQQKKKYYDSNKQLCFFGFSSSVECYIRSKTSNFCSKNNQTYRTWFYRSSIFQIRIIQSSSWLPHKKLFKMRQSSCSV